MKNFICGLKIRTDRCVVANAAGSPGLPSWDDAVRTVSDQYRDPKVLEMSKKLEPFAINLPEVPSQTSSDFVVVKERIAKLQFEYAKSQFIKVGFSPKLAENLFDLKKLDVLDHRYPYSQAFSVLPKILSRGKYAPFLRAVVLKLQEKRDLMQQYTNLDITPDDLNSIRKDVQTLSTFRMLFADFTGKRTYIENSSLKAKKEDSLIYEETIRTKAPVLVRIVSLTVQDLPLAAYSDPIISFETNPTVESRIVLDNTLIKFKNKLISDFKKSPNDFNLDSYLEK